MLRKNNIIVFRAGEKNREKTKRKQKIGRSVRDIRKSMKNDAQENQTDTVQRATTTYDFDCDQLGMFCLYFSVGTVVSSYMV